MLTIESPNDSSRTNASKITELLAFHERTRVSPADDGIAVIAVTATLSSYPSSPSAAYYCLTQQIDADDTEGATASYTADGGELFAINVGSVVPPAGTRIIPHAVGGRWLFRYDG